MPEQTCKAPIGWDFAGEWTDEDNSPCGAPPWGPGWCTEPSCVDYMEPYGFPG